MSNSIATGVAYNDPEFSTVYATAEIGYSTAAQGTVTQATSKSTGVTLNKSSGQITMNNAALANGAIISFTLTNSLLSAKDVIIVNVAGGLATNGTYTSFVSNVSAGTAVISLYNISAGSLSEAVVLNFSIIHAQ
jgi:hypothetical protein